ncbi:hypothetical protein WDL1P2_00067 (plasmid) [Variovorax sp. WDL1]|nr:hypothetical protein CHC06_06609 [Variovorax sp. B2]PNG49348.1 hypothetical protein CHC07_06257 [Variovorax sp. B4]VTV18359.1 hypothetical protein WDL1P2_00067 [Variovorax sp. WDL1]
MARLRSAAESAIARLHCAGTSTHQHSFSIRTHPPLWFTEPHRLEAAQPVRRLHSLSLYPGAPFSYPPPLNRPRPRHDAEMPSGRALARSQPFPLPLSPRPLISGRTHEAHNHSTSHPTHHLPERAPHQPLQMAPSLHSTFTPSRATSRPGRLVPFCRPGPALSSVRRAACQGRCRGEQPRLPAFGVQTSHWTSTDGAGRSMASPPI